MIQKTIPHPSGKRLDYPFVDAQVHRVDDNDRYIKILFASYIRVNINGRFYLFLYEKAFEVPSNDPEAIIRATNFFHEIANHDAKTALPNITISDYDGMTSKYGLPVLMVDSDQSVFDCN